MADGRDLESGGGLARGSIYPEETDKMWTLPNSRGALKGLVNRVKAFSEGDVFAGLTGPGARPLLASVCFPVKEVAML